MAGKIKRALDYIIMERSHGNSTIATTTKAKITLKGVNPDQFGDDSPDDPEVLAKVKRIANEFDINLSI
jgi:hypothetical protein